MSSRVEKIKQKLSERNAKRPVSPLEKWVRQFLPVAGIYGYELEYQVGFYFIDIAFPHIKFGVELDGVSFHEYGNERDKKRDAYLAKEGWEIYRISSRQAWKLGYLGPSLKYVYDKVYPNASMPYALAEALGVENRPGTFRLRTEAPEPLYDTCRKCKNYHDLNISCAFLYGDAYESSNY
jgi:very-short-patch-repair endonuclease